METREVLGFSGFNGACIYKRDAYLRKKWWEIILPGPLKTHFRWCRVHSWPVPEARPPLKWLRQDTKKKKKNLYVEILHLVNVLILKLVHYTVWFLALYVGISLQGHRLNSEFWHNVYIEIKTVKMGNNVNVLYHRHMIVIRITFNLN